MQSGRKETIDKGGSCQQGLGGYLSENDKKEPAV